MSSASAKRFLTFSIPTKNRLAYLRESFDSLLPQAEALGIEICVSDNCSSDGTEDYLKELQKQFPKTLRVLRQPTPLSLDENMIAALLMANSDYVILAGDDDVFAAGSVAQINKELLEKRPDLLVFQCWHTDRLLQSPHLHLPESMTGIEFMDPTAAFDSLWGKLPSSTFAVPGDSYTAESLSRFIGTSHAYAGPIWEYLSNRYRSKGVVRVSCSQVVDVKIRRGEKSWAKDAARIYLVDVPKWFEILSKKLDIRQPLRRYLMQYFSLFRLFEFQAADLLTDPIVSSAKSHLPIFYYYRLKLVSVVPAKMAAALTSKPLSIFFLDSAESLILFRI